jgi:hypothetical protein
MLYLSSPAGRIDCTQKASARQLARFTASTQTGRHVECSIIGSRDNTRNTIPSEYLSSHICGKYKEYLHKIARMTRASACALSYATMSSHVLAHKHVVQLNELNRFGLPVVHASYALLAMLAHCSQGLLIIHQGGYCVGKSCDIVAFH